MVELNSTATHDDEIVRPPWAKRERTIASNTAYTNPRIPSNAHGVRH